VTEIAGATGEASTGANGTGENTGSKTKVVFSDEQQAWLENWGNSMFAKGRTKAESEIKTQYEGQVGTLTAQVNDLKTQLDAATKAASEATTKAGKKEANEEVSQLKAQLDEMLGSLKDIKSERDTIRGERDAHATELKSLRETQKVAQRRGEFAEAARDLNFIDVDEVYTLIAPELSEDESGETVVMNPATKRPRINREGEPMKLSEYLAQFAAKKPHLVRAAETTGGTGRCGKPQWRRQQQQLAEKREDLGGHHEYDSCRVRGIQGRNRGEGTRKPSAVVASPT
jgi:chromosome segregation ATPase